jgi:flagellar hook-associated protein 3 FlgL
VRISNQMLIQNAMRGLRYNLEAMAQAQMQATSGRRVSTVSDAPIDAAKIMRVSSQISDLDQYRRNGISAGVRLSTEDTVLTAVNDLISQAKTIGASVISLPSDDPGRRTAMAELAQIQEQILSMANTKLGSEYIFGGSLTSAPPFQMDGAYVGDGQARLVEIDEGITTQTNHTGSPLFTDVLDSLGELMSSLANGTDASIQEAINKLDTSGTQVLAAQTEVGVRQQAVENVANRITTRTADLLDQLSELRDADPTEASVKVIAAQTALERAYSVVGSTLQVDILKYL